MGNQTIKCLGVDPGIKHTALAIVEASKHDYQLHASELVKTASSDCAGKRLDRIHEALTRVLDVHAPDAIAIEQVYHNINVNSSLSTGKVIGLCELTAYTYDLPVLLFTPQDVKRASGMGGSANKEMMLKVAQGIFGKSIVTHHEADAALCAVAGILHQRSQF